MVLVAVAVLVGCGGGASSPTTAGAGMDLRSKSMVNGGAYVPPPCWTKTEGSAGRFHNPCYTCHTRPVEPNYTDDSDLQQELSFPASLRRNPWSNLFQNRAARVAAIGDDEILRYVRQDNYQTTSGDISLARLLAHVPRGWDFDGDGVWNGYVPDCHFQFDAEGFDRAPDGGLTGWRAFAYYPFPGTFWPTNGSTDDVLIRLPDAFRRDGAGDLDLVAYKTNLAVVEALIKRRDVPLPATDETRYGVDLDKDGALGTATRIRFDWAPLEGRNMSFVGKARSEQQAGTVHLAAGLFPEGTEFLHSVRYLDVAEDGTTRPSTRMKELRWAKKLGWRTYSELRAAANTAEKEKHDFPDRLEEFFGDVERGVSNGLGWAYQGFIEDARGDLRPQTYEETVSCMGCHGGLGATTDGTFAFARKFDTDAFRGGWHHRSQKDLRGVKEPKVDVLGAGTQYEYSFYLTYNGAGDELRANDEVGARFFKPDGSVDPAMIGRLHDDVTVLLNPSPERALKLNKAYRAIVEEQSFVRGRDPTIDPAQNVETETTDGQITAVATPVVAQGARAEFNLERALPFGGTQAPAPEPNLRATVLGAGMAGPSGTLYSVSADGLIHKSSYSLDLPDFTFPFPDRITLPTRAIVPNHGIGTCYTCHRMPYVVPPADLAGKTMAAVPVPTGDATEGGRVFRLTEAARDDVNGAWSPDGAKIAWASGSLEAFHVYVMNADGSGKQQVTGEAGTQGWPAWSADGARIAYWAHDPATRRFALRTVKADGSQPITVAESEDVLDMPAWRPDGQYIAYGRLQQGNWDVWVTRADGSESHRLTTSADMESTPLWSPDGSKLSYKVAPAGVYSLTTESFMTFEAGLDSPSVHAWIGPESVQMSGWSPDGTKIAYTAEAISGASGADRVSYLAVVSDVALAGTTATASNDTILSGAFTLGDRGPVFSPDGTKVAFWGWDTFYRATLWLHDLGDGTTRQLTHLGYDAHPRWSPDGRRILFESNRSGDLDLWVVPVE
jgi:Tol biopolymer transport system component